ncbi:Glycoamylase-like domain-containing protein OS=Streptomyces microflavus OX=1919 GN=Smic_54230 PE=4 SV=1 [Streptomyces microflavus]
MDRRTFLTAAGTGAAALSLGAVTAPSAQAATPPDPRLLHHWFRDTYRSLEAMTTDFGLVTDKIDLSAPEPPPSPSRPRPPTSAAASGRRWPRRVSG